MDFSEREIYSWKVLSSSGSPMINFIYPCVPWAGSGSLCHPEFVSLWWCQPLLTGPWCSTTLHLEQRGCRGLRHKGITPFPGLFCLHLIQSSCGLLASFQINFWVTSTMPSPSSQAAGKQPIKPTNKYGTYWLIKPASNTALEMPGRDFFWEVQVYFVFVHSHLWASCLFFFPSNYSCVFYCLVKLLNFVLILLQTPLRPTWGSFTWGSLQDWVFTLSTWRKAARPCLGEQLWYSKKLCLPLISKEINQREFLRVCESILPGFPSPKGLFFQELIW